MMETGLGQDVKQRQYLVPNDYVQKEAIDEEAKFVSLIMNPKNKELLEDIADSSSITANHFLYVNNGALFAHILRHFDDYKCAPTTDSLNKYSSESKDPAASRMYFDMLRRLDPSVKDYDRYKNGIVQRYLQQRFYEIAICDGTGRDGLAKQLMEAKRGQTDLIDELMEKLLMIEAEGVRGEEDKFSSVDPLDEVLDETIKDLENKRDHPEDYTGLLTGMPGIDSLLNGFHPGDYSIIVGHPNGGKTTMLLNLALGLAENGAAICYVTVESTAKQLAERILSRGSKVATSVMRFGGNEDDQLGQKNFAKILKAKEQIKKLYGKKFVFITVPQKTKVTTLLAKVEKKKRTVPFQILIVDYLDVIDSVDKYPNRHDLEIGDVSVRLQAYGKTRGLAVITAQSFNNEMIKAIKKIQREEKANVEKELEYTVGLEGVGGTQKLARDCDYMWGLILSNSGTRMTVYRMKSRHTGKEGFFVLTADLPCCNLTECELSADGEGPEIPPDKDQDEDKQAQALMEAKAKMEADEELLGDSEGYTKSAGLAEGALNRTFDDVGE